MAPDDIDAASAAEVAGYLAALRVSHSKASVARAHSSIRGFYRFLVEEGRRDDDPAADLPSVVGLGPLAQGAQRGGDGAAPRRSRRDRAGGPARPCAARSALRDRAPG